MALATPDWRLCRTGIISLCAVYVTDSDDQDETGDEVDVAMKRYRVKEEGQKSYLSNAISESSKGALVNSIQYLRFGGEADLED